MPTTLRTKLGQTLQAEQYMPGKAVPGVCHIAHLDRYPGPHIHTGMGSIRPVDPGDWITPTGGGLYCRLILPDELGLLEEVSVADEADFTDEEPVPLLGGIALDLRAPEAIDEAEIQRRFSYHPSLGDMAERIDDLSQTCAYTMRKVLRDVPDCREREAALQALDGVFLHGLAGIARRSGR